MKKIVLLISLLGLSLAGYSQSDSKLKIGLRLAPNISFTSVSAKNDSLGISGGSSLRLMFGPTFDYFFQENYAFSTGLWYNVKSVNLKSKGGDEAKYNLQYLTIPVTIKLYTNEVSDDVKIYFQVGGTMDIKLAEKLKSADPISSDKAFKSFNVGPYIGVGGELVLSSSNTVFAGLNYSRGVIPILSSSVDFSNDYKLKSGQFALELGLKF